MAVYLKLSQVIKFLTETKFSYSDSLKNIGCTQSKKTNMSSAATWMKLQGISLGEIGQREKDNHQLVSHAG